VAFIAALVTREIGALTALKKCREKRGFSTDQGVCEVHPHVDIQTYRWLDFF
jgi:hypothetical protein